MALENITSKEFLDNALNNAVKWSEKNLDKHIKRINKHTLLGENFDGFNYSVFKYAIDNSGLGMDMWLDEKEKGLIHVSTEKLKWYQEREEFLKKYPIMRYAKVDEKIEGIGGIIEIDPESMFVHEITEFVVNEVPEVFVYHLQQFKFPHDVAHQLENINRIERGLKPWPYD